MDCVHIDDKTLYPDPVFIPVLDKNRMAKSLVTFKGKPPKMTGDEETDKYELAKYNLTQISKYTSMWIFGGFINYDGFPFADII